GVPAYPALQDDGDSASLAVHADPAQAVRLHPEGVRRLLRIALQDRIRQARRQLPVQPKTALLYAAIEAGGERKRGGGATACGRTWWTARWRRCWPTGWRRSAIPTPSPRAATRPAAPCSARPCAGCSRPR